MLLRVGNYSPRQRASTERKPISGVQRRRTRTGMPNDAMARLMRRVLQAYDRRTASNTASCSDPLETTRPWLYDKRRPAEKSNVRPRRSVTRPPASSIKSEPAAWSQIAALLLNLSESLTRN